MLQAEVCGHVINKCDNWTIYMFMYETNKIKIQIEPSIKSSFIKHNVGHFTSRHNAV
jgi:hypothetical protein